MEFAYFGYLHKSGMPKPSEVYSMGFPREEEKMWKHALEGCRAALTTRNNAAVFLSLGLTIVGWNSAGAVPLCPSGAPLGSDCVRITRASDSREFPVALTEGLRETATDIVPGATVASTQLATGIHTPGERSPVTAFLKLTEPANADGLVGDDSDFFMVTLTVGTAGLFNAAFEFDSDPTGINIVGCNVVRTCDDLGSVTELADGNDITAKFLIGSPAGTPAPFKIEVLSDVPEPASLALFGSALLGFGLIRRRRKNV